MRGDEDFGAFFRKRREDLELTQSEFCRRNGLDKGNISRLERGLVPPPQDERILESYARALKLESETVEWEQFFDLAAVATGRIPADLQDERTIRQVSKILRAERARRHVIEVRALNLETWADTLDARATLPQLIRKLVRASVRPLEPVSFPAHEGGQRPGWDGTVETVEASEFVPAGVSGWEMGVDKDPDRKAEEDFQKRTKDPQTLDRPNATFVFVTPRKWPGKDKWRREKLALGLWKDVRVYDSASLEEWLEQAPAVNAWLGGKLGPRPSGIGVLDDHWANLERVTAPSLKPEVFLASREKEVEELGKWLEGPPDAREIEGRSPEEVVDFLAAYGQVSSRGEWFAVRALIVEDRDDWRALASANRGLILIRHPSLSVENELVAEAVRQGHYVLLPSDARTMGRDPIRLSRVYRDDLAKELVRSGLEHEHAQRVAREAGGSTAVLKRILSRLPGSIQPRWSEPPEDRLLASLLLAGRWDNQFQADRSALETLTGRSYESFAGVAEQLRSGPDAPLLCVGSRWGFVSQEDAWRLLDRTLTREAFRRFGDVAQSVLGEDDPTFERPPAERWLSLLDGRFKEHGYSPTLRIGIAETLAILGATRRQFADLLDIGGWVEQHVRVLLQNQRRTRWASLSRLLPLLAEAAPAAFLEAVAQDLRRADSSLVAWFDTESSLALAVNAHEWLLRSLEVLAWSADYMTIATDVLATLDEKTSQVKLGSSALHSLISIFSLCDPQTTVAFEDRIKVLNRLLRNHPESGWRLLIGLLPDRDPALTSTQRPVWRDWTLGLSDRVSAVAERQQFVDLAGLLVEHAGDNVGRWVQVVQHYENLPGPVRKDFLVRLNGLAEKPLDEEARRQVADALREKVSWHRRFFQTSGALREQDLSELENLQRRFEPADSVRGYAWLFDWGQQFPVTVEGGEKRLRELRRSAVSTILEQQGWHGVQALAEASRAPELVGAAYADACDSDARVLPNLLCSADDRYSRFVRGFVQARFRENGWNWVHGLVLGGWSKEEIARFLLTLPFERGAWELAETMEDEVTGRYWAEVTPFPFGCAGSPDDVCYAARQLLNSRNNGAAIPVLRMALQQKVSLEPGLIMDVLAATADDPGSRDRARYDLQLLFQELYKGTDRPDSGIDLRRLGNLELEYIDVFDGRLVSPALMHRRLREDPRTFVVLLSLIYPTSQGPEEEHNQVSQCDARRAQGADRVLRTWDKLPGVQDNKSVDEKALLAWIKQARSLAEERGLRDICDARIGEILAQSPLEADESWPCIPVRDVLGVIGADSKEILHGFGVGILNKRRTYVKTFREGGDQERDLGRKYRAYADACKIEWPKIAETLGYIARIYDDEALREDERASREG